MQCDWNSNWIWYRLHFSDGTLTINAGETSGTITISNIVDDSIDEGMRQ